LAITTFNCNFAKSGFIGRGNITQGSATHQSTGNLTASCGYTLLCIGFNLCFYPCSAFLCFICLTGSTGGEERLQTLHQRRSARNRGVLDVPRLVRLLRQHLCHTATTACLGGLPLVLVWERKG
jgi:hypothetical protein